MSRGFIFCILAIVAGAGHRSALAQVDEPADPVLPSISSLRDQAAKRGLSPKQYSKSIDALFAAASDEQLRQLAFDSDPTVSLQSAWEQHLRASSERVPENDRPENDRPENDAAAERFLGFIEGRIGAPIPQPWAYRFTSTFYYDQPASRDAALARFGRRWQTLFYPEVRTAKEAAARKPIKEDSSIRIESGWAHITSGERTIRSDDEKLLEWAKREPRIAVQAMPGAWVVALYTHSANRFPLYCIEVATGKVLWATEVWATSRGLLGRLGNQVHEVVLTAVDQRVVVFGLAGFDTCYTEGFDMQSGSPIFRFLTSELVNKQH